MKSDYEKKQEFERLLKKHPCVRTSGRAAFLRQVFFCATTENAEEEIQINRAVLVKETNLTLASISNYNTHFNRNFYDIRHGNKGRMEYICFYKVNLLYFKDNFDCEYVRERLEKYLSNPQKTKQSKLLLLSVKTLTPNNQSFDRQESKLLLSYTEETPLETYNRQDIPQPSEAITSTLPDPKQLTDSDFLLFRKAYPKELSDLKKTRQAFFEFLPKSLETNGSNFERFMQALNFYAAEISKRRSIFKDSFDEGSIMDAHNFIWKLKWNDPTYLDRIKELENRDKPCGVLDERFQALAVKIDYFNNAEKLHLISLENGVPKWKGNTNALTFCEQQILEIINKLKGDATCMPISV